MAAQDFERVRESLLPLVEQMVVDDYAAVFNDPSRPNAYRWIRYEDPDPIGRLHWAVRRLEQEGKPPAMQHAALEDALRVARELGYRE
jgi:hypothetical protein